MKDSYINISKAFSSSLVERIGTSTILNSFVPIKQIAEAKGLKSTRSLRLEYRLTGHLVGRFLCHCERKRGSLANSSDFVRSEIV